MLSQGELHALREAAERAWDEDTRHPGFQGHPNPSAGQCYVTASWLANRLGGHVARKGGHYVWLSPDKSHVLDLTGDLFAQKPADPGLQGMKIHPDDPGLELMPRHRMHRPGPVVFKKSNHPVYAGAEIVPTLNNDRAHRFATRADKFFDDPEARRRYAY